MLGKAGFWQATRDDDPKITTEFVRAELEAQLDKFKALVGAPPMYVDGHNHIHVIPVVAGVLAEVLPKHNIQFIRCPSERLPVVSSAGTPASAHDAVLPAAQRTFFDEIVSHADAARLLWARHGLKTSDHFIGLQLMGQNNTRERLHHTLRHLPVGVTEYMCHPGHASKLGDEFSRSADRDHELAMLCDQETFKVLQQAGVQVASWKGALGSS